MKAGVPWVSMHELSYRVILRHLLAANIVVYVTRVARGVRASDMVLLGVLTHMAAASWMS